MATDAVSPTALADLETVCDVAAERGLGLDVTRRRHGASFMSSGRYHHHIASNVWHSAGAGPRDQNRAGLAWLSLAAADDAAFTAVTDRLVQAGLQTAAIAAGIETADPWGTRLRVTRA